MKRADKNWFIWIILIRLKLTGISFDQSSVLFQIPVLNMLMCKALQIIN